jgi:hypothetical protein
MKVGMGKEVIQALCGASVSLITRRPKQVTSS